MKDLEKGFYYHYKHDPKGEVNNYAYEVLNVAHHTEIKDWDENAFVIYQPLYESSVYKRGKHWDARPLSMFLEKVVKNGVEMDRFTKITDPKIISELENIKKKLY
ncbi:DUF1653 domain-containing protein [Candidatus Nomurabacteria bacterium]|nr:DUF1653 domain-containing protein [Candidatus Nomurabacteria bacterium]